MIRNCWRIYLLIWEAIFTRELTELDKAKTCLVESIALCRETNHPTRLSIALTGLSAIAFTQSEMDLSQKAIEESMQIALDENDLWGQSYALRVKADHLRVEEKFDEGTQRL